MTKINKTGLSQAVRFNILRRDNFTCRYCGRSSPNVELHVDHVKARAKGGTDDQDNLVTACSDCNFGKRTTDVKVSVTGSTQGLVGLYGFTFDEKFSGLVHLQFKVIRASSPTSYLVQTYSWWFGEPSVVVELDADYLLSDKCELYADADVWKDAFKYKHEPVSVQWIAELHHSSSLDIEETAVN